VGGAKPYRPRPLTPRPSGPRLAGVRTVIRPTEDSEDNGAAGVREAAGARCSNREDNPMQPSEHTLQHTHADGSEHAVHEHEHSHADGTKHSHSHGHAGSEEAHDHTH